MNDISTVKIEGETNNIKVVDAQMCEISVNGSSYIVPYPIAKLINKMSDELAKEQRRKRKDDEEINTYISKTAFHIAYCLCGGDKDGPAYYGENLLANKYDHQVPLPPGYEYDDGTTTQDFGRVVAKRILTALSTKRELHGRSMIGTLDGSEDHDTSLFVK